MWARMRACPTLCLSTFVDRLVLLFYGPVSETRTFASKGVKIPRKFASSGERERDRSQMCSLRLQIAGQLLQDGFPLFFEI